MVLDDGRTQPGAGSGGRTGTDGGGTEAPLYRRVKAYVLERIRDGALQPGDRVPSEHELVAALGVSRMTANRALRELTAEGRLTRVAGAGTFVAPAKPLGTVLEIRNIADEIQARGGAHSARVLHLATEPAAGEVAEGFGRPAGTPLFHSILVHAENGRPILLEDRWVAPDAAPDYLAQDFARATPSEHLLAVAPVREVEHLVEAVLPDARIRTLLDMEVGEPCLLLRRRTWIAAGEAETEGEPAEGAEARAEGRVASLVELWFPGGRYRLGGRFRPG